MVGIASVMLGALAARGLVFRLGSPGALAVGAGIRAVIAFSWILVPLSPRPAVDENAVGIQEKQDHRRIEQV